MVTTRERERERERKKGEREGRERDLPARVAVFSDPINCLALPKSVNRICPTADNIQFSGLRSLVEYKVETTSKGHSHFVPSMETFLFLEVENILAPYGSTPTSPLEIWKVS